MNFYSQSELRAKGRAREYRANRVKFPGYLASPGYADKSDAKAHAKDIGVDQRRVQKDQRDGLWYVIAPTLDSS